MHLMHHNQYHGFQLFIYTCSVADQFLYEMTQHQGTAVDFNNHEGVRQHVAGPARAQSNEAIADANQALKLGPKSGCDDYIGALEARSDSYPDCINEKAPADARMLTQLNVRMVRRQCGNWRVRSEIAAAGSAPGVVLNGIDGRRLRSTNAPRRRL